MTREEFECVVEDMLFHTQGMSRREQAGAVVNSVLWPELMKAIRERDEARAKALKEAAAIVRSRIHRSNGAGLNEIIDSIAVEVLSLKDSQS